MKKITFILLLSIALFSCRNEEKEKTFSCTYPEPLEATATNGNEYLYQMTYDMYDFDQAMSVATELLKHNSLSAPMACSSVRNNNFHGRNLDFFINHQADIIVKTNKNDKHFASIGTAACNPLITKEVIDNHQLTSELQNILPLCMTDGINENGVCINVNVVPTKECNPTTGTNDEAPALPSIFVVRYILDNATSVDNAIELLKTRNIFTLDTTTLNFEYHWMISDSTKTVVVETWNNKLMVVNSEIMTNFYVCHPETPYGMGHERFDFLMQNKFRGGSEEGMLSLMKKVWYSQSYLAETQPRWYSENFSRKVHFSAQDLGNIAKCDSIFDISSKDFTTLEEEKIKREGKFWFTTHTCVYDLAKKTVLIAPQENGTTFNFSL